MVVLWPNQQKLHASGNETTSYNKNVVVKALVLGMAILNFALIICAVLSSHRWGPRHI